MKKHPWLETYGIKLDTKYLIIGTHPPMPYCGKLEFFYGNMNEFWRFLQAVYQKDKIYNNGCPVLKDLIVFLTNYNISITDMVEETSGKPFSVDNDMDIVKLNSCLKERIENTEVQTIYLTSFGGAKSALSLFKKWVKENYPETKTIPDHKKWIEEGLEINLNARKYLLELLYSPSPSGRRGIKRSEPFKKWSIKTDNKSADDFRIYWYKMKLPKSK